MLGHLSLHAPQKHCHLLTPAVYCNNLGHHEWSSSFWLQQFQKYHGRTNGPTDRLTWVLETLAYLKTDVSFNIVRGICWYAWADSDFDLHTPHHCFSYHGIPGCSLMILGVSRRSSWEVWLLSSLKSQMISMLSVAQSRVGEMGWDAINIRLSYCRHLSLQLLPPADIRQPNLSPDILFTTSLVQWWHLVQFPTKRLKGNFVQSSSLLWTWLPGVGQASGLD